MFRDRIVLYFGLYGVFFFLFFESIDYCDFKIRIVRNRRYLVNIFSD